MNNMTGGKLVAWFAGVGAALSLTLAWWPLVAWADKNANMAAWVQAIGSIAAIGAALAVVVYQHRLQVREAKITEVEARLGLFAGAFQLIGAVHQVAAGVSEYIAQGAVGRGKLDAAVRVLGTLQSALGRVDHLRFDSHELIAGVLVAEACATQLKEDYAWTLGHADVHGNLAQKYWLRIEDFSVDARSEIMRVQRPISASMKTLLADRSAL